MKWPGSPCGAAQIENPAVEHFALFCVISILSYALVQYYYFSTLRDRSQMLSAKICQLLLFLDIQSEQPHISKHKMFS